VGVVSDILVSRGEEMRRHLVSLEDVSGKFSMMLCSASFASGLETSKKLIACGDTVEKRVFFEVWANGQLFETLDTIAAAVEVYNKI